MLMEFGTRGIAKIIECADLDYVIIDMEHSGFGIERVADLIAYLKATDIAPIVRVPENLPQFFAGVFDAGAVAAGRLGQSAEAARPSWKRQVPRRRPSLSRPDCGPHGLPGAKATISKPPMPGRLIIVQIETGLGLENLDAIVPRSRHRCFAIGQNDLSHSRGIHGQLDHPLFRCHRQSRRGAARHGKIAKIHAVSDAQTAAKSNWAPHADDARDVAIFPTL